MRVYTITVSRHCYSFQEAQTEVDVSRTTQLFHVRLSCPILRPPPIRSPSKDLCRALCRNPSIPTHILRFRLISLCHKPETRNMRRALVDMARLCHSDFFGVASSRMDSRF